MEDMDADLPGDRCDADAGNAAPGSFSPPAGALAASDGGAGDQENAWSLLACARQLVDQGQPSLALQAVLAAIRSDCGEQAVLETLHRARELYRNQLRADAAADELASLFAECAIAEARGGPARSSNNPPLVPLRVGPSIALDSEGRSILAMSGRQQVMLDAFADGSSFVCLECGGLVSNHRKDEHFAYWCS